MFLYFYPPLRWANKFKEVSTIVVTLCWKYHKVKKAGSSSMHQLICYRPPNVNINTSDVSPLETVLIFCLVTCYAGRRGSKNRWPERLNRMPGHPSRESGWTHITPHRVCNYGKNGRKTGWLIFWRGHRPSKYLSLRSSTPLTLKVLLRQNQGAAKMCSK